MKKIPFILATFFGFITCVTFTQGGAQAATASTAVAKCEKRVTLINKRGTDMAKKSQSLQARYKKSNETWKTKMINNRIMVIRNKKDSRLEERANFLNLQIDSFENNVKLYNEVKADYIAERNAQVKSYKNFKADCNQSTGRAAAQSKVKQLSATDSKKLSSLAKGLNKTYTELVRPDIIKMRDNRTQLLDIKKTIKNPKQATQYEIDTELEKYRSKDVSAKVDDNFDSGDYPIVPPPPPTR